MNRLERKRPQIDPTKIRKHSQIVAEKQDPFLVLGDRTQTDYGFTVSGVQQKAFETLYMVLMPNAITPTWLHPKKQRVYRVVSGSGYLQTYDAAAVLVTRPLAPGDEVLVEAGISHRITSGVLRLEMYVTQESKYVTNLEEVAPAETVAAVPEADLRSVSAAEKHVLLGNTPVSRRNSRAAEQIAASRGARATVDRSAQNAEKGDRFLRGTDSGINAKPILDFSEDGAG
jgi:mannose-6-phosphate isomerase-like protein (cupin superfamily)